MTATPTPFFIDSPHGRCFAVHHAPNAAVGTWGHVLCVPGFNEEMNRCRSMLTAQAHAFAKQGLGTLVIDLHGTGESDGRYVDGRWDTWVDDVQAGIDWLDKQPGGCVGLLGIRLGVLLAAAALRREPGKIRSLMAWQPVADGKSYFTQFLRVRMAANMDRTDIPKETTADMRRQLAEGIPVEVAGYEIHPDLAAAIEQQRLADLPPPEGTPVAWFEKVSPGTEDLPPASQGVLKAWEHPARPITATGFDAPAFWALYDRVIAADLVAQTAAWAGRLRSRP
jgi:exosortase A-associated hydrolase 2